MCVGLSVGGMHSSKRFQSVEPNDFHETTLVPSSSVRQMKMMMRNSLPKLTKKAQTYTYSREKRCSWKTNLSHTLSFYFILPIRPVGDAMATVKINTRNLVKISLAIHSSQIPVTARAMNFTLKIRVLILLIMKKRKQKQSNGKDGAGERERESERVGAVTRRSGLEPPCALRREFAARSTPRTPGRDVGRSEQKKREEDRERERRELCVNHRWEERRRRFVQRVLGRLEEKGRRHHAVARRLYRLLLFCTCKGTR